MKIMKRLLTVLMVAIILATGSSCQKTVQETSEQPSYDNSVHGEITFQEMFDNYKGVDPHALDECIGMLEEYYQENSDDKEASKTVAKIYKDICDIYELQQQQMVISEILSYLDIGNEEMADKAAQDSTGLLLLANQGRSAIRNALNGPYGEELQKVIDPLQLHVYQETIDYTPEMEELANQSSSLVMQYLLEMSMPVSCEFEGKTYSSDETLPKEHEEEINRLLWQAREERIAPIYAELINNRNAFARLLGYDNYLDYSYAREYNRDYTSADAKAMLDHIYEICAPLLISSTSCIGDASLNNPLEMSNEEMFKTLGDSLERISPELKESLDYMKKYGLYTMGDEPQRIQGSLMEPIYSIRAGCIFIKRNNVLSDYVTMIHEYGHYNNAYQVYSPALGNINNLEILEVHSQGLELLISDSVKNTFPAEFGDYGASIVQRKLKVILSAVMIARFEIECFEHPEMNAQQMREAINSYASLAMAGADELSDIISYPSWTQIHHLFNVPLYYISYAISALSSLDVYSEYLKDHQTGWDKYTKLVHISPDMKYVEAVSDCGLHDMTKEENIRSVIEVLTGYYQDEFTEQMNEAMKNGKLEEFLEHFRENVSDSLG